MKAKQNKLPSPKQPMLEEFEEKTVLSERDREELLEKLVTEPASDDSSVKNSQPAPDAIIKSPQEMQKRRSDGENA